MQQEIYFKERADEQLKRAMHRISEMERKRMSLPDVKLTNVEREVLVGIVNGRSKEELDKLLNLSAKTNGSYRSIIARLLIKFEAFSVPHIVYKAMKMDIIQ